LLQLLLLVGCFRLTWSIEGRLLNIFHGSELSLSLFKQNPFSVPSFSLIHAFVPRSFCRGDFLGVDGVLWGFAQPSYFGMLLLGMADWCFFP